MKQEMEWRDISSAPKDTRVLLWFAGTYKLPFVGWYNYPDNEWEIIDYFKDKKEPYVPPTHWMPLPAAPKGAL